jgi:putative membrane protein
MFKEAMVGMVSLATLCLVLSAQTGDLSNTDKAFLRSAAEADMTEAHVGKMAQDKSSADSIKNFGQSLVQDRTKAYEELTALANKTGVNIPKGIDIRRIRTIEDLTREKGSAFDRDFAMHEVQDHRRTIAEFKREADKGRNADLKAYAQKMIPTLEEHLRKAEELEKSERTTSASADRRSR